MTKLTKQQRESIDSVAHELRLLEQEYKTQIIFTDDVAQFSRGLVRNLENLFDIWATKLEELLK